MFELVKSFHFEAAHWLPFVPEGHRCKRLHGHSFRLEIAVRGNLDESVGWVIDYADIAGIVDPIVEGELDHQLLNEIAGLENPTSERLAHWLWHRVVPELKGLHRVSVSETASVWCHFYG
ncbi:MAG: 6-carboxytetrahydropterin synthase QueD [Gemmatimonadaceae bacterium]|nr:6-carboxytetrahydropterin synthase QueD [Gloeobacterales cyanobacterium ES-bin-141]